MKFTWQEKFTRQLESVPDEMLPQLVRAVLAYGTDGVEPDLAWPLNAIFEGMREDIDNSHDVREKGRRGGGRTRRGDGVCDESACKPDRESEPVAVTACKPNAEIKNGLEAKSQSANRLASQNGNRESACEDAQAIPIHTNPIHTNQDQEKRKGGARPRFTAPTPEEVDAFASEQGLPVDGAAFCDFYASKGWRVGSSPMRDWKAAARNWARRDGTGGRQAREASRDAMPDFSAYL